MAGWIKLNELMMIEAVLGIIQRNQKLLVSKRPAHKPYAGFWEFPGGKIEKNESHAQAISRECHEELGIEVKASQFLLSHEHAYPDQTVRLHLFLISEFLGEPDGKENQMIRWVDYQELLSLRLLEGNNFILRKIKNYL